MMDAEKRVALIEAPPTQEVVTSSELRKLFETAKKPKHYIGFEISGLIHLGFLMAGMKIQDFVKAGCDSTVFLADWHAWINKKLGGDWEAIQQASKYYEAAFRLISDKIKIVRGSELYHNNDEYWKTVIKISQKANLARIQKSLTIMGRKAGEALDFASLIYPPMQAADMIALKVDIAHAGMDQRKVHMLARDVFPKIDFKPPVAVHHALLPGLVKPAREGFEERADLDVAISSKMSKSKPWTCIFIHDSSDEINRKLINAWCPPKEVAGNPVLDLVRFVVFRNFKIFEIERSAQFGGSVSFENMEELEKYYGSGALHPLDLKKAVAKYVDKVVDPYRKFFEKPANAKLLDVFKQVEITR